MVMIMGEVLRSVGRRDSCQECDSSQGGVKVVRNLFQLMERYDGHGGGEHRLGEV